MPICPACKTEQRVRKGGMCPNCLADIVIVDGFWVLAGDDKPNMHILKRFENHVSAKLSTPTRTVYWQVPRKSHQTLNRELYFAGRIFEEGGGDLEYVDKVLDEIFTNRRFAWKNRESLISVLKDFSLAKAVVDAKMGEERIKRQREEEYVRQIEQKEDVFLWKKEE